MAIRISLGYIPQHCVLEARYLHRAYYTYLIHEITLECVHLYGYNSILSGVVVEQWLASVTTDLLMRG